MSTHSTPNLLLAGVAELDITPSDPVDLAGSMVRRLSEGVNDPLHARAVVLANESTRLVFILLDLIYLGDDDCQPLRQRIAALLGIPTANVCISCTHTHRGPVIRKQNSYCASRDEGWFAWMLDRVVEAAKLAAETLVPAEAAWGRGREGRPQYNRRWHLKGGPLRTNPRPPEEPSHPAGPTDPDLPVLLIRSAEQGELLAVIANYSLHYIGDGPGRKLSADYFGAFAEAIKCRIGSPRTVALLTHGASGDINNLNAAGTPTPWYPDKMAHGERSALIAGWLVSEIETLLAKVRWSREVELGAVEASYLLRLREIKTEDLPRYRREADDEALPPSLRGYARSRLALAEAGATQSKVIASLRVGDWAASTFPGEMFCQFGIDLKFASPFPVTAFFELTNGYSGYIPTHYSYLLGGYETWHGGSAFAQPGTGEEMLRLAITQLLELYHGAPPVFEPNPEQLP